MIPENSSTPWWKAGLNSHCPYDANCDLSYPKREKTYRDLGSEHYNDLNRDKLIKRNIQSLERLGVNVAIQPS